MTIDYRLYLTGMRIRVQPSLVVLAYPISFDCHIRRSIAKALMCRVAILAKVYENL